MGVFDLETFGILRNISRLNFFFALLIHYLNTLRPTHRVLSIDWTLYPPKNFIYRSLYIYFLYPQVLASTHEDLIYAFDLRLHNSMTC